MTHYCPHSPLLPSMQVNNDSLLTFPRIIALHYDPLKIRLITSLLCDAGHAFRRYFNMGGKPVFCPRGEIVFSSLGRKRGFSARV